MIEKIYLCDVKTYKDKLNREYALTAVQLENLIAEMQPVHFDKGTFVVCEGERNDHLYILKSGVWRNFRMNDGEEMTLWFASEGEFVFPVWGYAYNEPSKTTIEVEADSEGFAISKKRINELCATSLDMANLFRTVFEHHAFWMENFLLFFADNVSAEQRYLAIMQKSPELLQQVSLKKLASYLYVTPQSLSRIRAGLRKR